MSQSSIRDLVSPQHVFNLSEQTLIPPVYGACVVGVLDLPSFPVLLFPSKRARALRSQCLGSGVVSHVSSVCCCVFQLCLQASASKHFWAVAQVRRALPQWLRYHVKVDLCRVNQTTVYLGAVLLLSHTVSAVSHRSTGAVDWRACTLTHPLNPCSQSAGVSCAVQWSCPVGFSVEAAVASPTGTSPASHSAPPLNSAVVQAWS